MYQAIVITKPSAFLPRIAPTLAGGLHAGTRHAG